MAALPEGARAQPMVPFGLEVDLAAARGGAGADVRALARAVEGLVAERDFVLIRGLDRFIDGGTTTIESALEELMAAFGPREAAIHFRGVHDASAVHDHPTIRVLGTARDSAALLDRVGYCWHQGTRRPFAVGGSPRPRPGHARRGLLVVGRRLVPLAARGARARG